MVLKTYKSKGIVEKEFASDLDFLTTGTALKIISTLEASGFISEIVSGKIKSNLDFAVKAIDMIRKSPKVVCEIFKTFFDGLTDDDFYNKTNAGETAAILSTIINFAVETASGIKGDEKK